MQLPLEVVIYLRRYFNIQQEDLVQEMADTSENCIEVKVDPNICQGNVDEPDKYDLTHVLFHASTLVSVVLAFQRCRFFSNMVLLLM